MDTSIQVEIVDLGDAVEETKQWLLYPIFWDSIFLLGEWS
jgi:hypothetical protein